MKKKMNGILLILLVLGWVNGLAAVEIDPATKTLTLEQAIQLALQYNPTLEQSQNQVLLNKIDVNQGKANFLPDLKITGSGSHNWSKSYDTAGNGYEGQDYTSMNMTLSSNYTLFNGFYNTTSLKQSKLQLKSAEDSTERSRQSIIFATLQRFVNVVLAKELIAVDTENLEAQKLQLALIQDYYDVGKRPITDLHQQKAEISQSQYLLLASQRNLEVYKLLLKQSIGLEPDSSYDVENLQIDGLVKDLKQFKVENSLDQALEERPDLEAQQMTVQAAEKGIKLAQSGYWPTLTLFANFGSSYNNLNNIGNFSDQFLDYNLNGSFGLSLSFSIFDKNVTKNSVAQAKIALQNQQLEMKQLKDQIAVEMRQAIEDYRTAAKQLTVTEDQLTYAKAALESIEARYKVDAATMVELTQARATYVEAAYNRVQAKYNLYLQAVAVAYYTGNTSDIFAMLKKAQ